MAIVSAATAAILLQSISISIHSLPQRLNLERTQAFRGTARFFHYRSARFRRNFGNGSRQAQDQLVDIG